VRVFNQYLWFLVLAAFLINAVLAFTRQQDLTLYFTVNVLAYLVITVLHAYFSPRARRLLSTVAIVLFGGFLIVLIIKVMEVLG